MTMTNIKPEFEFLNRLRKSGETNMFGAAPFLQCAFPGMTKTGARAVLSEWMRWVESDASNRDL